MIITAIMLIVLLRASICCTATHTMLCSGRCRVLDSMSDQPRPTRAEATDVANIVLDGADGVLLGAETLRGKWPVPTVRMAVSICQQGEKVFDYRHNFDFLIQVGGALELAWLGGGGGWVLDVSGQWLG